MWDSGSTTKLFQVLAGFTYKTAVPLAGVLPSSWGAPSGLAMCSSQGMAACFCRASGECSSVSHTSSQSDIPSYSQVPAAPGACMLGCGRLGGQLRIQVTVERCHETPTGGARIPVGGGEKATQICPRDAVICAEPEAEQTNSEPHRERRRPPKGGVCSISTGQRGHWAHWGTHRVERGSA